MKFVSNEYQERSAIVLRAYQEQALEATLAALGRGEHPVIALPTGSGKSHLLAALCQALPGRILVVTHRQELLTQDSAILARHDAEVEQGIYSAGLKQRTTDTRVVFGGLASLYRRMDALQAAGSFAYVLVDECFPAGTLVDGRPIETYSPGEYVWSFNHDTSRIEKKKILSVSKRYTDELLTITSSSGIVISCTPRHPFWNGDHYVHAQNLSPGTPIYQRDSPAVSLSSLRQGSRAVYQMATEVVPSQWVCLLQGLWSDSEKIQVAIFAGSAGYCEAKDADQQSYEDCYDTTKSQSDIASDWASPSQAGRQWAWAHHPTTGLTTAFIRSMEGRAPCDDFHAAGRQISLTYLVSPGSRSYRPQNSDRDRWTKSLLFESASERCEERCAIDSLRMDRVAFLQRRCFGKHAAVPVYNIEVADNHNYFAEDILVHNCHRCPPPGQSSMYATIFAACPTAARVGLSATPYRHQEGPVYGDPTTHWFTTLAADVGIRTLTPQYLSPLRGILTAHNIDVSHVRTQAGEFVLSDLSQAASDETLLTGALTELCALAAQRQHWLVFGVDVAHSQLVTHALQARGIATGCIVGTTEQTQRASLLEAFRQGALQALVNCEVLTTGLDVPHIDAVVLMRPTLSRVLCLQMLGRGARQAEGKVDCAIFDFSGNLERHAPIDALIAVEKSSAREEAEEQAAAVARERERQMHDRHASLLDPFAETPTVQEYAVEQMRLQVVRSKRYPGKQLLQVSYECRSRARGRWVPIWLCLEYPGMPRQYAAPWFQRRGMVMPLTASEGFVRRHLYRAPVSIVVDESGQYPRILQEHLMTQTSLFDEEEPTP